MTPQEFIRLRTLERSVVRHRSYQRHRATSKRSVKYAAQGKGMKHAKGVYRIDWSVHIDRLFLAHP
jgi:hypothetical protein